MTEQRPIDVSTLRDGDVGDLKSSDYKAGWRLRCEGVAFGIPWAIEGEYDGKYVRSNTRLDLRWALGEDKYPPSDDDRVTAITVLDRPSPFEMGARVVHTDTGRTGAVDGFHLHRDGFPLGAVSVNCGGGVWFVAAPDAFTLAPEPAPFVDSDDLHPVIAAALEAHWARYSDQGNGTLICRDCAAVVADGYLMGHDILHDAIRWPVLTPATEGEPAPITVGSWWADEEGIPHVVEALNTLAEVADLRRWEHDCRSTSQITYRGLRKNWTRLDSPPEPLVGKLYVIGGVVRQSTEHGWHRSFNGSAHRWDEICAALDKDRLATLRILGSVD